MRAILLIAVLATAAIASQYAEFEQIEKTKLGKTLLDTIAVQLQSNTGEPLEYLFGLLYDLEDRYVADQKEDDANNHAFQAVCDDDLSALDQDIATSTKRSSDLQDIIDALTPVRNQKNGQRAAKIAARKELQAVIDAAAAQRLEENTEFEEKREEFEFVSDVLAQARRLFTDNLQAPSFLQAGKTDAVHFTPEVMTQVGSHLTAGAAKINKLKHVKAYGKAIKLLAGLTSRTSQVADQELTGRVVKLIDDLQAQLNSSFDLERKAEDKRQLAYNQYNALLTKDLNKYNSQIANLDAEIASLNDRIDATTNSQNDVNQRLNDKQEQRNDRENECQEAAYDYQARRNARDQDRGIVSQLIGILNNNLRQLREYIALRLAAGDDLS
jgi:predicted  nucleic acid-binding Zn-ribbon protein